MRFDPTYSYRMPVAFGPMPGPRQTLPGSGAPGGRASVTTYTVPVRTTVEAATELLPPGFVLDGDPVVTVEYTELADVPWLAGRGYDTFAVKLPVRFAGRSDDVRGPFVAVVWESRADPIITGREELGYAKLFADLGSRTDGPDAHRCTASWDGHTFAELELTGLTEDTDDTDDTGETPGAYAPPDGVLHFRYVPGVAPGSPPEGAGPVLIPTATAGVDVVRTARASGRVRFVRSTFEQLPTFFNVVNALAGLPVLGHGEAVVREVRRDIDNRGQRYLV